MFTNEFEFDSTVTTVMDESGEYEDVQLIIGDDTVYIRQFNDDKRETTYDLIAMTPKMFLEMQHALKKSEGMFRLDIKD
tara:strand:+ start:1026 stop:1262 length:237 start_codon:yes stop_codon:yes gene_type:complete